MTDAIDFVFSVISGCIDWLSQWAFLGVPFLYYLIGFAVIAILIDYVF